MKFLIKAFAIVAISLMFGSLMHAQSGIVKGRVFNSENNEAISFANIYLDSIFIGAVSDIDGNYRIEDVEPGIHTVICTYIGFEKAIISEINVTSTRPTILDIPLKEEIATLNEVVVVASAFNRKEESATSLRTINATEVSRNPGGNRDISKVIQVLPGVASTVSFRNDIIIRGGAPSENRFFLDGIEVPNINHFATQGSSGGPVGMINVNFIREVDFYASAFPVNRGNALSSVMDFKQITGNDEKLTGSFTVGSSDIGLTLDGPIGKNSTFILSARRSYLQLLFKALSLPFLPTYNDFQYKQVYKIDDKNKITLIGLGAIDDFELNESVNDDLTDQETIDRNNYILGNLPVNSQWNYAIGAKWTHYSTNSYQTFVVSRNHLRNKAIKFQNNIESPEALLLDYDSGEIENKVRFESDWNNNGWKWKVGAGFQNVRYNTTTFNKKSIGGQIETIDYNSDLSFNKYAVFAQTSKTILNNKLTLSLGVRTDINDYSSDMSNPLDQISPRISASYKLKEKLRANFNIGRYYQLPAYTVMGFRNNEDELVNKKNGITYIQSDHLVGGLELSPTSYSRVTLEAFYKTYKNYPFLIGDSISLANLGGDFGVIGNEEVKSTSDGRSYGIELLMQQKMSKSVYGILSYTFVRSEFKDKTGSFVPSAWDNRHILNIAAGKKLRNNWEFGFSFRLMGGAPFTPYDEELSANKSIWDVRQQGVLDYNRLNQERNDLFHALDIRIDKKWFFKKWALETYLDIENAYGAEIQEQDFVDVRRDEMGNPLTDPVNPNKYQIYNLNNTSGTVIPSIGIMIEF